MATREEMLFAMQAIKYNLLDREQVEEALTIQRSMDEQGKPVELAKILVKKGMLSRADFEVMRSALRSPSDVPLIVDRVPGFRILARVGSGGMANVYRAVRECDGLVVALKVLFPNQARNPRFVKQFLREAELISRLDHRHIVRGYDYGFTGQRYFMALEFIDGPTVLSLLEERGHLPVSFACFVTSRVAHALDYLASEGVVHRDIKPENILVTHQGAVKIIDLGFATEFGAKLRAAGGGQDFADVTCGTVEYMSPEQARGDSDLDPRADIYSLGASLYHMAAGEVPFSGSSAYEVMTKQVEEELSPAAEGGDIPERVHLFIEKMMTKDREQRYASARALITEFDSVMECMSEGEVGSVVPLSEGSAAFKQRAIEELDEVRAAAEIAAKSGSIEAALGRRDSSRRRMPPGKAASGKKRRRGTKGGGASPRGESRR